MNHYIAHRGYSSRAPENTTSAIKLALTESYFSGIEIDIRLTRDKKIVVIHDALVNRTSNLSGFVRSMTLKELRKGDFGKWYDEGYVGEKIPTLEEVLMIVNGRKQLYIEIKEPGMEKEVIKCLMKFKTDHVYIQSFNREIIKNMHKLEPNLKFGVLDILLDKGDSAYQSLPIQYVGLNYFLNSKSELFHFGKTNKLFLWTVNERKEKKLINRKVKDAFILTDRIN